MEGFVVSVVPFCSWGFLFYSLQFPLGFGELAVIDELEETCGKSFGKGHDLASSLVFVRVYFFYTVLCDFENSFAVREVGA